MKQTPMQQLAEKQSSSVLIGLNGLSSYLTSGAAWIIV